MKVLTAGASDRELTWWNQININIENCNIEYLNCSSRRYDSCFNLRDFSLPLYNYSPNVNDKYQIPASYLVHEHNLYPGYSFKELVTKFEIHLRAYEKFFEGKKYDLIFAENGGFIWINSLLLIAKRLNIPIIFLEGADVQDHYFAFLNNKGPSLRDAIKIDRKQKISELKSNNLVIHHYGKKIDLLFKTSLIGQALNFNKYLLRRKKSKYISIDGSIRVLFILKTEFFLRKALIFCHKIKYNLFQSNLKRKKRIIFPLHLERDLHISERTNIHSQTDFLIELSKMVKKPIYFKLHPYSIVLGISLIDHIKLLFSKCFICEDKPDDLNPQNDEVYTLGSKYGLQAARNKIKTFIYGNTFFSPKKSEPSDKVSTKKLLKIVKETEKNYEPYRHSLFLYNQNPEALKKSSETIIEIIELFK